MILPAAAGPEPFGLLAQILQDSKNPFRFRESQHHGLRAVRRFDAALAGLVLGLDHHLASTIVAVPDAGKLGNGAFVCEPGNVALLRPRP
jgi:hypothetical protein